MAHLKTNSQSQSGFTIVELLIVIVVIGILAAITIVAYSGITARANTTSGQQAADNIARKAELYYAEPTTSSYPATFAALSGAAATTSYYVPASAGTLVTTAIAAAPAKPSYINFYTCGTSGAVAAPTSIGLITAVTGNKIGTWDYTNNVVVFDTAGVTSGLVGTFNVACFISTT